jgi:hypothetical protein
VTRRRDGEGPTPLAAAAAELSRGQPEEVGLSSTRLARITETLTSCPSF